jgi:hypothetical protein
MVEVGEGDEAFCDIALHIISSSLPALGAVRYSSLEALVQAGFDTWFSQVLIGWNE